MALDLTPSDPILQNVNDGTVYGNPYGSSNVPTASQQILVNTGIPQGVVTSLFTPTNILLIGGGVLIFVMMMGKRR